MNRRPADHSCEDFSVGFAPIKKRTLQQVCQRDWRLAVGEAIKEGAVIFVISNREQYVPWNGQVAH